MQKIDYETDKYTIWKKRKYYYVYLKVGIGVAGPYKTQEDAIRATETLKWIYCEK